MSAHAGRAISRDELTEANLCRIDAKIAFADEGCWLWTGSKTPNGYGHMTVNGSTLYAHRLVYAIVNGETPAGLVIRHSCDTRDCVRPDHLLVGTQADNQRDMALRDRCGNAKITNEQAREIAALYDSGFDSRDLASQFGISRSAVYAIANGWNRGHATGRGKAPSAGTSTEGLSRHEGAGMDKAESSKQARAS